MMTTPTITLTILATLISICGLVDLFKFLSRRRKYFLATQSCRLEVNEMLFGVKDKMLKLYLESLAMSASKNTSQEGSYNLEYIERVISQINSIIRTI